MPTTTVTIGAEYYALLRQYSKLSGMTNKAATEYAIDQILVGEIEEYFMSSDAPEMERLTKAANALLPDGWCFNVVSFGVNNTETLIGLNLGLDGIVPTYITRNEALAVRHSLYDMPSSGGSFCIGGKHLGNPVFVRRQGQGILFQLLDRSTGKPSGPRTTIACKTAHRIAMALDLVISAAATQDEVLS